VASSALKRIPVAQFKARCLRLFDQIGVKKQTLVVTKHGVPIAEIRPIRPVKRVSSRDALKGTVDFEGDVVSPIKESWGAFR